MVDVLNKCERHGSTLNIAKAKSLQHMLHAFAKDHIPQDVVQQISCLKMRHWRDRLKNGRVTAISHFWGLRKKLVKNVTLKPSTPKQQREGHQEYSIAAYNAGRANAELPLTRDLCRWRQGLPTEFVLRLIHQKLIMGLHLQLHPSFGLESR